MTEEMLYNTIDRDMTFAGIDFHEISPNLMRRNKRLKIFDEFDIVLKNGDTIALIEIKHKVRTTDIKRMLEAKLHNYKALFPEYSSYKLLLGIGGGSFDPEAESDAINNGIGIIKLVNDKVEYYTDNIKVF